ncbi:MAG: hypothetical protein AAGN66_30030 [Acidobacteriota bacterium]
MQQSRRLAIIFATLLLSSGLALAADAPSLNTAPDVEATVPSVPLQTQTEVVAAAASLETSNRLTLFQSFEAVLIALEAAEKNQDLTRPVQSSAGYCLTTCQACYPVGPSNPQCADPDWPGINFPCTYQRLC